MARRRGGSNLLGGLAILIGLVLLGLFLSSPRHRQFYSQLTGGILEPLAARPSSTPRAVNAPDSPRPPPRPRQQDLRQAASPQRRAEPEAAPPRPRTGPREAVVKVVNRLPTSLPSKGPPSGWALKEFEGAARVEVVREDFHVAFHLVSQQSSFALYRDVILDLKAFPILTWWWKVTRLPTDGDIREIERDDQAAQIYLVFPRWPSPRSRSHVVGYVWDTRAPVGSKLTSPRSSNVRVVVVRSGAGELGRWVREERNAYQDYVDLFGRNPPRVGMVAVMIDSNDTRSRAEAYIDDLLFARAQGSPTLSPSGNSR
ncbi:MAG: DUF3047 domain-containing protein [Candidatus Methylomirabilia bacterium]